jgi:hypothetical protein
MVTESPGINTPLAGKQWWDKDFVYRGKEARLSTAHGRRRRLLEGHKRRRDKF